MEDSKEGPKLRLIVPELPSTSQGSTHGYRESATETPAAQDEQPQRAAQGPLQGTRPEASSKNHAPVPTTAGPLATPSHQTTTEGEHPRLPQGHRVSRPGGGEISYSLLADKLRKWGFTFDGHADPLAFIERLEERVESYGGSPEQLPRAISGLLTEFLEFFLPPRYFQRLEDTIRSREQKPKESFRDYLIELRLMMQRAQYTREQELERIYENLRPEYQMYTRRQDFRSLTELTQLVSAYETARDRDALRSVGTTQNHRPRAAYTGNGTNPQRGNTHETPGKTEIANRGIGQEQEQAIDVQRACRNCGENGHFSGACTNRQKLFCWECGHRGVRTINCCRKPAS
ncbi:uncharacterized protein LOC117191004 [Drosophila miranda]|uniref:uncharacterized protein LOC117191004 n=1 Tax=Drosophila miranda TaxID=7229 RepID=UPI00143F6EEB|nr:uncharacterized protein LOC117191004 [Drosophila miranda]